MISLCRKDVFRNRYFIPVLFTINLMYTMIHFQPEKVFYKMHTGVQAVYVLSIALMIPFLLYMRYGDENIGIIEDVIKTKILNICQYYLYYWFWILLVILSFTSIVAALLMFSDNSTLPRSGLFVASILILCITLMQLCVVLFKIIKNFLRAFFVYLICLFVLVLVNSPDSYLWFVYETEIENLMLNHWIGKVILLLIITSLNIVSRQFGDKKRIKKEI